MYNLLRSAALAGLFIAAASASALPNADTNLAKRSDFAFRFYTDEDCSHSDDPTTEYPAGGDALSGNVGQCYNAPALPANMHRVETDNNFDTLASGGLVTYCNGGCSGGSSAYQRTYCSIPPSDCAIGSFKVEQP